MYEPTLGLCEPAAVAAAGHEAVPRKTVIDASVPPATREQYRQLAATLHNAQEANGLKAVMIASAVGGEGKTLTAANLALTFAESYQRRVLLVDADLRKPSLHHLFPGEPYRAWTPAGTPRRWAVHVREVAPNLGLLTRKAPSVAPIAELTSGRMRELIQEARDVVDWIVVDTPPIAVLPDATLLASVVDGTVLVVRAGSTPLDLVKRAVDALDAKKTLGVVLNGTTRPMRHHGYGYENYYGHTDAIETRGGSACQPYSLS